MLTLMNVVVIEETVYRGQIAQSRWPDKIVYTRKDYALKSLGQSFLCAMNCVLLSASF